MMLEMTDLTSALRDLAADTGVDIPGLAVALAILAASVVVALATRTVLTRYGQRLVKSTATTFDDAILHALDGPLQAIIVATGIYVALKTLNTIPANLYGAIDTAFVITVIIIAAFLATRLVRASLSWYKKEVGNDSISKLDLSMVSFLDKASSIVIYTAASLMVLTQMHVEITPLLASMGIAGIAVALAAQELLSNVFGAFAILTDKPYKVGDRIELSTGEYGDVLDIGLRSTRLLTLDNRVIVIPNADISKSRISNYSEPDPRLRYTIKIGVAYHSDIARVASVLKEIAGSIEGALKDPAPIVYIDGFGDYSVNLVMLVWGKNFRENWDIPDKVYHQAMKRFAAEGIEIPYPVTSVIYPENARPAGKTSG